MHMQIIATLNKTKLQKLYRITEKKKNEKEVLAQIVKQCYINIIRNTQESTLNKRKKHAK